MATELTSRDLQILAALSAAQADRSDIDWAGQEARRDLGLSDAEYREAILRLEATHSITIDSIRNGAGEVWAFTIRGVTGLGRRRVERS